MIGAERSEAKKFPFAYLQSKQYFLFMKDKKKEKSVTSAWYLTNFRDVTSYFRLSNI